MVSMDRYQDVSLGFTAADLEERFGKPYATHSKSNGAVEYEYIERITAAGRVLVLRHYFFVIQDGKVTSKRMMTDKEVPLDDRNSFDLQTSKNSLSF